eukprot:364738-Chlamydomonas_euryale.AAC.1
MECNVWRPRRGYHCETCGYCMVRLGLAFGALLAPARAMQGWDRWPPDGVWGGPKKRRPGAAQSARQRRPARVFTACNPAHVASASTVQRRPCRKHVDCAMPPTPQARQVRKAAQRPSEECTLEGGGARSGAFAQRSAYRLGLGLQAWPGPCVLGQRRRLQQTESCRTCRAFHLPAPEFTLTASARSCAGPWRPPLPNDGQLRCEAQPPLLCAAPELCVAGVRRGAGEPRRARSFEEVRQRCVRLLAGHVAKTPTGGAPLHS